LLCTSALAATNFDKLWPAAASRKSGVIMYIAPRRGSTVAAEGHVAGSVPLGLVSGVVADLEQFKSIVITIVRMVVYELLERSKSRVLM